LLHPAANGTAELESVAVSESVRRTGIGRALCSTVLDWCRTRGATEIVLEVRATSAGAIALYTALGFTETGRRPRYYLDPADDALIMRRPLESDGPTSRPGPAGVPA
jgi:ribosomal-protein-alanine N-acetyltransferase